MAELRTALAGFLALSALAAQATTPAQPASCWPLTSLRAMKDVGEAVRAMYPMDVDPKSPQAEKAADRVMLVDRQNTAQLRPWLQRCGWPSIRTHGEEVEGLVWLLVQHADQDRPFQLFAIDLLKRGVLEGSAPGAHLAYLEDRVAIGMGKPQRYGTQAEQKGPCHVELLPIDDLGKVAARRRQAGLPPLDTYVDQLRSAMLPPTCRGDGKAAP